MAAQKKTPTKKAKVSTTTAVKKSSAKTKSPQKPSTRYTLKKATLTKKNSSTRSTANKPASGKVTAIKSQITRKSAKAVTKSPDKKPVAKKSSTEKKSAVKKIKSLKTAVAKPAAAAKPAAGKKLVATKKVATKKNAPVAKAPAKKSALKKNAPAAKAPAKKSVPKKKSIKKPEDPKKASKKTTSELLKAIKARDIETHSAKAPAKDSGASKKNLTAKTAARAKPKKRKMLPIVPPMQKAVEIVISSTKEKKKRNRPSFNKKDLNLFRSELLTMRDHFTGQTFAMKHDALQRDDEVNPEEDGTDAFMRLQALNQMNDQQHIVADIDMALTSIEKGSYGSCEMCECLISKPRLKARPFAKFCVKCKSEMERSNRFNKPR